MVGEQWLRAAAAVYARAHLPSEPSLLMYGAGFPDFLDTFEPAQAVPYLGAVARIDRAWTEAHAAADAPLLDPAALAALDASAMTVVGLVVHPAARWAWHADWPITTLWRRNRHPHDEDPATIGWTGEGALITRPVGPVQVEALSRGGVVLLDASGGGASVADAVAAALAADPGVDLAALVHQLLRAGALTWLRPLALENSS